MKELYVSDVCALGLGAVVTLQGWISDKHDLGKIVFLHVADSTGLIQVVVEASLTEGFEQAKSIPIESAVQVIGTLHKNKDQLEIVATCFTVVSVANISMSPSPRSPYDIQDVSLADHLLKNRHLYIRNPNNIAILQFRDLVLHATREWFFQHKVTEVTAPILTRLPLYDDGSALSLKLHEEQVFLTQCVGFYLEAAVHGLERIYNIGPSFRGEESRSKRHLMEYWHIKAEFAWGNREDIIQIVETLIRDLTMTVLPMANHVSGLLGTTPCTTCFEPPFPRISYREAVSWLQKHGYNMKFGVSMGTDEEKALSTQFTTPFWIVGIPRTIEPFPYVIDPDDPEVTMTADLIANNGYGELLGVAEKITDPAMLQERMIEKGKWDNPQYAWVREMRDFGFVPHIGFGMGVERYMRWILGTVHVRDMIPFPRTFGRRIYP